MVSDFLICCTILFFSFILLNMCNIHLGKISLEYFIIYSDFLLKLGGRGVSAYNFSVFKAKKVKKYPKFNQKVRKFRGEGGSNPLQYKIGINY